MNKKIVVISLFVIGVLIFLGIFGVAIYQTDISNFDKDLEYNESIVGVKIADPDRIVYRNDNGEYFQFKKSEEKYNKIKALLGNSIKTFVNNGEFLQDSKIDEIHSKSFIEFDYETISKNYIIQLDKNEKQAVIKLADTGGNVVTEDISNINKIKKSLNKFTENEPKYKLEYKELYSINTIDSLEYKYHQLFNEINFGTHQVKITNLEQYEVFKSMCNLAFEETITEETFKDNVVILTVYSAPKINVKVNLGNIKYTYSSIQNAIPTTHCHLLIVNKIVNTDCIYNKDLTQIESKIDYDNMKVEHDSSVENLDSDIYVTNYDEFYKEYNLSSKKITLEEAEKIADIGFEEAERICGAYDKSSQTHDEKAVRANNFFTRKITEMDEVYEGNIEVYEFTRIDDMELNGVKIYVDKRLGKIVGGAAFGD